MKRVFGLVIISAIIAIAVFSAGATDTYITEELTGEESLQTSENLTEALTEAAAVSVENLEGVINDYESGKISLSEAITVLAEKSGISREEAEAIIDRALAWGDEHLNDTEWWGSTSEVIRENKEFWVVVILAIACIVAIIFGGITLFAGVVKKVNRIEYGTGTVLKDSGDNKAAISQTLGILAEKVNGVIANYNEIKTALEEKDKKLSEQEAHIASLESGMLDAEMYNLQIQKLIYSRTNLPLTDKSLLDLWYAKAEDSLKKRMTSEDIARHEEIASMLDREDLNNG